MYLLLLFVRPLSTDASSFLHCCLNFVCCSYSLWVSPAGVCLVYYFGCFLLDIRLRLSCSSSIWLCVLPINMVHALLCISFLGNHVVITVKHLELEFPKSMTHVPFLLGASAVLPYTLLVYFFTYFSIDITNHHFNVIGWCFHALALIFLRNLPWPV